MWSWKVSKNWKFVGLWRRLIFLVWYKRWHHGVSTSFLGPQGTAQTCWWNILTSMPRFSNNKYKLNLNIILSVVTNWIFPNLSFCVMFSYFITYLIFRDSGMFPNTFFACGLSAKIVTMKAFALPIAPFGLAFWDVFRIDVHARQLRFLRKTQVLLVICSMDVLVWF